MQITISKQTAKDLELAARFLYAACTKATADNPEGVMEFSPENMKVLGMTKKRAINIAKTGIMLRKKLNNNK
ncbi:hypothetical protein [uncultured Draconibacterium sp.]|uniref:hypothetical protein n=1 Tax=uncultured Draconibacterium sp. TaxID=1573823 RepID=UPI0032612D9E